MHIGAMIESVFLPVMFFTSSLPGSEFYSGTSRGPDPVWFLWLRARFCEKRTTPIVLQFRVSFSVYGIKRAGQRPALLLSVQVPSL